MWSLGNYAAVAVTGLGNSSSWDKLDEINGDRENARIAAAAGAKLLISNNITDIDFDSMQNAQSVAEGAILGTYKYQGQKTIVKKPNEVIFKLAEENQTKDGWQNGEIVAKAQNWARILMDTPANLMTPTIFADTVTNKLKAFNVECIAHNQAWAESQKMGSFLSVSRGSDEEPKFLEISYNGKSSDENPICLVGKGVTFDSGGVSIKPSAKMDEMKADMGGAACVASTILALAEMKAPVNVKGFIPLCENMINGKATKPGDVVFAMNGKSICVDNTDAEGRLILADALCYASKFNPKLILDIATLTGAIRVALGDCVSGVFTNSNELWNSIHQSGSDTGDRVWRMPLFKHYTNQMTDHEGYDLNNLGKGTGGGSCTAAAFLKEFVPKDVPWIHVDMAGVMGKSTDQSYTKTSGMSGRPMRTLVEFVLRENGLRK